MHCEYSIGAKLLVIIRQNQESIHQFSAMVNKYHKVDFEVQSNTSELLGDPSSSNSSGEQMKQPKYENPEH